MKKLLLLAITTLTIHASGNDTAQTGLNVNPTAAQTEGNQDQNECTNSYKLEGLRQIRALNGKLENYTVGGMIIGSAVTLPLVAFMSAFPPTIGVWAAASVGGTGLGGLTGSLLKSKGSRDFADFVNGVEFLKELERAQLSGKNLDLSFSSGSLNPEALRNRLQLNSLRQNPERLSKEEPYYHLKLVVQALRERLPLQAEDITVQKVAEKLADQNGLHYFKGEELMFQKQPQMCPGMLGFNKIYQYLYNEFLYPPEDLKACPPYRKSSFSSCRRG